MRSEIFAKAGMEESQADGSHFERRDPKGIVGNAGYLDSILSYFTSTAITVLYYISKEQNIVIIIKVLPPTTMHRTSVYRKWKDGWIQEMFRKALPKGFLLNSDSPQNCSLFIKTQETNYVSAKFCYEI